MRANEHSVDNVIVCVLKRAPSNHSQLVLPVRLDSLYSRCRVVMEILGTFYLVFSSNSQTVDGNMLFSR